MIPLTANTSARIYTAKSDGIVTLMTDSTTVIRVSKAQDLLDGGPAAGIGLTAYWPIHVAMKKGDMIYGICTSNANVTVFSVEIPDFTPVAAAIGYAQRSHEEISKVRY